MTDPTPSGFPAATSAGTFGTTRGSGLARGKRVAPAAAPTTTAAPSGYRPTSLQVITPASEYRNPFAPEPSASEAPAAAVASTALEPIAIETPVNPPNHASAVAEASAPIRTTIPVPAPAVPAFAAPSPDVPVSRQVEAPSPRPIAAEVALETAGGIPEETPIAAKSERAELNILPAAETRRPAVRWETDSASATPETASPERSSFRTDRPVFRPESRRGNQVENRGSGRETDRSSGPGDSSRGFGPRENAGRPAGRERNPQPVRPAPIAAPAPSSSPTAAPRATGGFIGWLKGWFGRRPAPEPVKPAATPGNFGRSDDRPGAREGGQDGHRRRRRGGRGRGQGFARGEGDQGGPGSPNRGPREDGGSFRRDRAPGGESSHGSPEGQPGEHRGDDASGHRPRRHRGGRGRNRGGEPRSEGHKGGGAI